MLQDERLIELLSGSLDGALSAEETSEMEAALASSAEARDLLAQLTSDKEALRALPELKAPDNLKQRALLKARASGGSAGFPWRPLLMAASIVLVVGLGFYTFRPIKAIRNRLHLNPGVLATRIDNASEELSLAASGSGKSHVMLSDAVSGKYKAGAAHVHFKCDAGGSAGGKVAVRLAFDFDGDGDFDLHSEQRVLEVDGAEGYQDLACEWPAMEGMQDLDKGKVQLELSSHGEGGPPLKVKLEPEQARLDLPYDQLLAPGEAAT